MKNLLVPSTSAFLYAFHSIIILYYYMPSFHAAKTGLQPVFFICLTDPLGEKRKLESFFQMFFRSKTEKTNLILHKQQEQLP